MEKFQNSNLKQLVVEFPQVLRILSHNDKEISGYIKKYNIEYNQNQFYINETLLSDNKIIFMLVASLQSNLSGILQYYKDNLILGSKKIKFKICLKGNLIFNKNIESKLNICIEKYPTLQNILNLTNDSGYFGNLMLNSYIKSDIILDIDEYESNIDKKNVTAAINTFFDWQKISLNNNLIFNYDNILICKQYNADIFFKNKKNILEAIYNSQMLYKFCNKTNDEFTHELKKNIEVLANDYFIAYDGFELLNHDFIGFLKNSNNILMQLYNYVMMVVKLCFIVNNINNNNKFLYLKNILSDLKKSDLSNYLLIKNINIIFENIINKYNNYEDITPFINDNILMQIQKHNDVLASANIIEKIKTKKIDLLKSCQDVLNIIKNNSPNDTSVNKNFKLFFSHINLLSENYVSLDNMIKSLYKILNNDDEKILKNYSEKYTNLKLLHSKYKLNLDKLLNLKTLSDEEKYKNIDKITEYIHDYSISLSDKSSFLNDIYVNNVQPLFIKLKETKQINLNDSILKLKYIENILTKLKNIDVDNTNTNNFIDNMIIEINNIIENKNMNAATDEKILKANTTSDRQKNYISNVVIYNIANKIKTNIIGEKYINIVSQLKNIINISVEDNNTINNILIFLFKVFLILYHQTFNAKLSKIIYNEKEGNILNVFNDSNDNFTNIIPNYLKNIENIFKKFAVNIYELFYHFINLDIFDKTNVDKYEKYVIDKFFRKYVDSFDEVLQCLNIDYTNIYYNKLLHIPITYNITIDNLLKSDIINNSRAIYVHLIFNYLLLNQQLFSDDSSSYTGVIYKNAPSSKYWFNNQYLNHPHEKLANLEHINKSDVKLSNMLIFYEKKYNKSKWYLTIEHAFNYSRIIKTNIKTTDESFLLPGQKYDFSTTKYFEFKSVHYNFNDINIEGYNFEYLLFIEFPNKLFKHVKYPWLKKNYILKTKQYGLLILVYLISYFDDAKNLPDIVSKIEKHINDLRLFVNDICDIDKKYTYEDAVKIKKTKYNVNIFDMIIFILTDLIIRSFDDENYKNNGKNTLKPNVSLVQDVKILENSLVYEELSNYMSFFKTMINNVVDLFNESKKIILSSGKNISYVHKKYKLLKNINFQKI